MSLEQIRQQIIEHESNAWALQQGYVPVYTANPEARIMIVGQAPGRVAQETRTPWNDVSGDTLRKWLNLSREEFYGPKVALVPMDFYYPGKGKHGDLPPRKDFAKMWHPKLRQAMPRLQTTLLVGAYAQKYYLGRSAKGNLTITVQNYQEYAPEFIPMVHPSPLNFRWRAKNPWFEKIVVPEAQNIVRAILDT